MKAKENNKKAIVCVDDERLVLDSLKIQLSRNFPDVEIEIAEHGEEALELVDELVEEGYDVPLVISDHIMPNMLGDELLVTINEKHPQTLNVLLTGLADADAVGNVINEDALYRYMSKPWMEPDLILTVKEGLSAYYNSQTLKERNEELKNLITELEIKNIELEQFTHTVSHDLKSPLITIKGFISFLEQDLKDSDHTRVNEDVNHIKSAADRMNHLLDDLLTLSRVGTVVKETETCTLKELVGEACKSLRRSIKNKGVTINLLDDKWELKCEKFRIIELLHYLLDNAIKFNGDQSNSEINIGVMKEGDQPVYFIQDNGIGIESKFHTKIFGLFEKLKNETEGTGIGLTIAKKIVKSQGGDIWVESEGIDKGSTFYFTLDQPKADMSPS